MKSIKYLFFILILITISSFYIYTQDDNTNDKSIDFSIEFSYNKNFKN